MNVLNKLFSPQIFREQSPAGVQPPKGYLVAYINYSTREYFCYPVLMALFVRLIRKTQAWFCSLFAFDLLTRAYLEGFDMGRNLERDRLESLLEMRIVQVAAHHRLAVPQIKRLIRDLISQAHPELTEEPAS